LASPPSPSSNSPPYSVILAVPPASNP
jgi:hypothetical protein